MHSAVFMQARQPAVVRKCLRKVSGTSDHPSWAIRVATLVAFESYLRVSAIVAVITNESSSLAFLADLADATLVLTAGSWVISLSGLATPRPAGVNDKRCRCDGPAHCPGRLITTQPMHFSDQFTDRLFVIDPPTRQRSAGFSHHPHPVMLIANINTVPQLGCCHGISFHLSTNSIPTDDPASLSSDTRSHRRSQSAARGSPGMPGGQSFLAASPRRRRTWRLTHPRRSKTYQHEATATTNLRTPK